MVCGVWLTSVVLQGGNLWCCLEVHVIRCDGKAMLIDKCIVGMSCYGVEVWW